MIRSLTIRNLATIEEIEINFQEGFSILTGETGTGKSIIIGGIRLAAGEKGSPELIRTGSKETSVEAIFDTPQTSVSLESSNLALENSLFIQRKISDQGPGKIHINGTLSPVKTLKELGDFLVDIYGQNDHVFLRNSENQLDYLDSYADALPLRADITRLAQDLRRLSSEKTELEAHKRERVQHLDFLDFQIKEIEKAKLRPGEEEDLRRDREILKNAEKVNALVQEALHISYSEEYSISSLLAKLQKITQGLSAFDKEFEQTQETMQQFAIFIKELSDSLIKFQDNCTASPENLESFEERLSLIENMKRKYGSSIEEILEYLEKAKKEHQNLTHSGEKLADMNNEIEQKYNAYLQKSQKLSALRKKAGLELEKQIEKEIGFLGMKKARFKIQIQTTPPDPGDLQGIKNTGTENMEFLISPNPGEELKPLRKIASGGELSRIMLALKSVGKDSEKLKTLIFDEIDSGIGGKTAEFVAQKLKNLSRHHQVICITHLPQIASFASHHYIIEKKIEKNRTYTTVQKLGFEQRVNEIARLSAGSHITDIALQNAREMLLYNLEFKGKNENSKNLKNSG